MSERNTDRFHMVWLPTNVQMQVADTNLEILLSVLLSVFSLSTLIDMSIQEYISWSSCIPKGVLVEANTAHWSGDKVKGKGSNRQAQGEGLLVSFTHKVAHQLIIQPALQIEESRQNQSLPHPAARYTSPGSQPHTVLSHYSFWKKTVSSRPCAESICVFRHLHLKCRASSQSRGSLKVQVLSGEMVCRSSVSG